MKKLLLLSFQSKYPEQSRPGILIAILLLLLILPGAGTHAQQKNPPRVMLQGFWWGSWHDNYPNGYYNYLTRLAPRLRELGIDAIWVFPPQKAGQREVKMQVPVGFTYPKFYESFDNYDLGDKYQKGTTATRGGTKDEYLRMIAVMHANGIDVIQDVLLNHNSIGGPYMLTPLNGAIDPQAPFIDPNQPQQELDFQQSKNYRYVSFTTPVIDESAQDYLSRKGRWPKNWQNFHPDNPAIGFNVHPCPAPGQPQGDNVCKSIFGYNIHDYCVYNTAFGQSSNATYNPMQYDNYMYDNMAKWLVWFKKQAGFDGVRLDAVKHIETGVVRGLVDELQNNAGWASGGEQMFAVGELIDSKSNMDNWVGQQEAGRCGTFDFGLRNALRVMVTQIPDPNEPLDYTIINNLPSAQQDERERTVTVINNHDSFRPDINPTTGTYSDYKSGGPFLAPLDPNDPRMPAAYVIACALDGSPDIFIEDLFQLNNGLRYTHDPINPVQLVARTELSKIIKALQVMDWKDFSYKVRTAPIENPDFTGSPIGPEDILVIEREGRAIITVNDGTNGNQNGLVWVNCGFPIGTTLVDYSSAIGAQAIVQGPIVPGGPNRVQLQVPNIDPVNGKFGYGIWSTANFQSVIHNPPQRSTTHEWELANDLGDSHPSSLGQGGELVTYFPGWPTSNVRRYVGKIYAEAGKMVTIEVTPEYHNCVNAQIWNQDETDWAVANGSGGNDSRCSYDEAPSTFTLTYTPITTGWHKIYVQTIQGGGQRAWVKVTYTAPRAVDPLKDPVEEGSHEGKSKEELYTSAFPNPSSEGTTISFDLPEDTQVRVSVYDYFGNLVDVIADTFYSRGNQAVYIERGRLQPGYYIYRVETSTADASGRFEVQ